MTVSATTRLVVEDLARACGVAVITPALRRGLYMLGYRDCKAGREPMPCEDSGGSVLLPGTLQVAAEQPEAEQGAEAEFDRLMAAKRSETPPRPVYSAADIERARQEGREEGMEAATKGWKHAAEYWHNEQRQEAKNRDAAHREAEEQRQRAEKAEAEVERLAAISPFDKRAADRLADEVAAVERKGGGDA